MTAVPGATAASKNTVPGVRNTGETYATAERAGEKNCVDADGAEVAMFAVELTVGA